jgi:hypothetical protein
MIGIIYLKLNLSLLRPRFKVGIARLGRRAKRWREIQHSTPGRQVGLFFAPVLFPNLVEKFLHSALRDGRAPLRVGSGRTEWFRLGFLGWRLLFAGGVLCGAWAGWGGLVYYLIEKY